ncbi:MAG: hypothetical protein ABMA64_41295 [Myxococcota bacterium]
MKCTQCGEADFVSGGVATEPFRSLPGVWLVDLEVETCPACGESSVAYPALDALAERVAQDVATRPGRLGGGEIRFLRKYLDWSGSRFAELLDSDPPTVSRWEHDAQRMTLRTEQVLRLAVVRPTTGESLEAILLRPSQPGAPLERALRWDGSAWVAAQLPVERHAAAAG